MGWIDRLFGRRPAVRPAAVATSPRELLPPADPSWMAIARRELGQHEVPGPASNARIIEYHACCTLGAASDEVPWCAAFIGWSLKKDGKTWTRSALAASYKTYGLKLDEPRRGAIVVLTRDGGSGHVAFFDHIGPDGRWWLLGGNQGDAVSIKPYDPARVVAIRWPV